MVTPEEIRQLALLAKLEINEDEIEPLARQMEKIIAFTDTINSADVGDTGFDTINGLENVFRADEVLPSLPQEEILKNAESIADGCFVVRKRGGTR